MTTTADILRLKPFLDKKVAEYNAFDFIEEDPVSIPHLFERKEDIEIMGFFAAILAWGQRKTIINKCRELIERMDGAPYDFVTGHSEKDLQQLVDFKHRTFNDIDLLYFIRFFQHHYSKHASLEEAFVVGTDDETISNGLIHFRQQFFSLPDYPHRTKKHVSSPAEGGSTCKRLNMFLRWMVRSDKHGVDFGIWQNIKPSQLLCPLDLHVDRVARKLGLITIKQTNWAAVEELTSNLRLLDPDDPVKYDFALFGLGVMEKFWDEK
jgi:uncharacterized protein (TIGR02757 family)